MASDEVGVAEPHLAARREAPETVWWRLVEVVLLDVHLAGEPDDSRPEGRVRRVVWRVGMVVLDCHFDPHSPDKALRFNVACAIQI
jgi:hypothetical protein